MRKIFGLLLFFFPFILFAQQVTEPQKIALVIGNGNYTSLASLANSVNDAHDVSAALRNMGFSVETVLNANLDQMDRAIMQLKNRLSVSPDTYGFIFYAGHGVQSNGENYLIPVDANIPGESFLRSRSLSVQAMLDELNSAGNSLNVVVLDACRDNPFGWSRSGSRGLAIINNQPADSIIVFATSAGQRASDGTGRNGLFTRFLLPNLSEPGLEVTEVFRRTGAEVSEASGRQQIPAIYNQFFGTAYLGSRPVIRPPSVYEVGASSIATGSIEISTVSKGTIQIIGSDINQIVELPAWGILPIDKINSGNYRIIIGYDDGKVEEKTIEVGRDTTVQVGFSYRPTPLPANPVPVVPARKERNTDPKNTKLWTVGASVGTSFSAPWLIATVQGTIAPFRYSFFDVGVDIGMFSGYSYAKHFSIYPYLRYAFFLPIGEGGWYTGAGMGVMFATYTFSDAFTEGKASRNIFAADFFTGYIFKFGMTVSYSFRTNFKSANHKLAVGYSYRFR